MRGRAWLVLALVAGCGRAGEPPARPAVVTKDTPYFPMQPGARWTYRGPGQQMVIRVVKREPFGGIDCAVMEVTREKSVTTHHWFTTAEGVYMAGVERRLTSSPLRFLKLPPKAGETWQTNRGDGKQAVFVQAEAEVTVPAGTYQAVTLQGEITEGKVRVEAFTYWFAPEVGIVKQVIRQGDRRQVYELEKYEPGK